jgi:signal peptidase II
VSRARALFFAAILVFCVGCDQLAKTVATHALGDEPMRSLFGDVVRVGVVHNGGAFLSLGAGLPDAVRHAAFVLLVPVALALVCALAWRSGAARSRASLAGLALLAGGGLGNWIDRLLQDGLVTDFVSLGIGPLRTGIFNVADVCIVAGALLFVLWPGRREAR